MVQQKQTTSRKKILLWSAALLSSLSVLKFFSGKKQKEMEQHSETVKMLTQDGKLVEVDKKLLASAGKKISNQEFQKWIHK